MEVFVYALELDDYEVTGEAAVGAHDTGSSGYCTLLTLQAAPRVDATKDEVVALGVEQLSTLSAIGLEVAGLEDLVYEQWRNSMGSIPGGPVDNRKDQEL